MKFQAYTMHKNSSRDEKVFDKQNVFPFSRQLISTAVAVAVSVLATSPAFSTITGELPPTTARNSVWQEDVDATFNKNWIDGNSLLKAGASNIKVGREEKDCDIKLTGTMHNAFLFSGDQWSKWFLSVFARDILITFQDAGEAKNSGVVFLNVNTVNAKSLTILRETGTFASPAVISTIGSYDISIDKDIYVDLDQPSYYGRVFSASYTSTIESKEGNISVNIDSMTRSSIFGTDYLTGTFQVKAAESINLSMNAKDARSVSALDAAEASMVVASKTLTIQSKGTLDTSGQLNLILVGKDRDSDKNRTNASLSVDANEGINLSAAVSGGSDKGGIAGIFVGPYSDSVKIQSKKDVTIDLSGEAKTIAGISSTHGTTTVESDRFDVTVRNTRNTDSNHIYGLHLEEDAKVVISADATITAARGNGAFSDANYSTAVNFESGQDGNGTSSTIEFQKNATLKGDYALKSAETAATLSKTGTGDLTLDGRVDFAGLLDVKAGSNVILNGTSEDKTFNDRIGSYKAEPNATLTKNSDGILDLGFADNQFAGKLVINKGRIRLTNTQSTITGNITIDGKSLTIGDTQGVFIGASGRTLTFNGATITFTNLGALTSNQFYTLASGFNLVEGNVTLVSSDGRTLKLLEQTTDEQGIYRFSVEGDPAPDPDPKPEPTPDPDPEPDPKPEPTPEPTSGIGDGLNNAEIINRIAEDTNPGKAREMMDSIIGAGLGTESQGYALDSLFDLGKLSGASYAALNASDIAAEAVSEHLRGEILHQEPDLWIEAVGSRDRMKKLGRTNHRYGLKTDVYGVTVGADVSVRDGTVLGAAFTFVRNDIESTGSYQKTKNKQNTYGVKVYGKQSLGERAVLIGQIGYVYADNDIEQELPSAIGGLLKGDPESAVTTAQVSLEIPLQVKGWEVRPYAGVKYDYVRTGGFEAKHEGKSVYRAEKQANHVVQVPIGVRAGRVMETDGWTIEPMADIRIVPTLSGNSLYSKIHAGNLYGVSTKSDLTSDVYGAGTVGLELTKAKHAFGLKYRFAAGASDKEAHSVRMQYRYSF